MWTRPVVFLLIPFLQQSISIKTDEQGSCPLPLYPKHGTYEAHRPSGAKHPDVVNGFQLTVTCDKGYNVVGSPFVACLAGHWFDEMPECLPICKEDKYPNVVSCGLQEAEEQRCVLSENFVSQVSSRRGDDDIIDCGKTTPAVLLIVSGGRIANGRELPWHAGIYTKMTSPYMQICGGTLVSKTVVVSAAHCYWSETDQTLRPASNYAVGLGKIYRPWNDASDKGAQKFDVKEIKLPPRYRGSITNFQDDIAAVILSSEAQYNTYVKPICLSFDFEFDLDQLKNEALGKVGGWGLTSEDGRASQVLKIAELPYIDVETCLAGASDNFMPYVTSDKICAGYKNGTAVCKGDSGGGLIFPDQDGRYYLRGIISTAPKNDHHCNVYHWATFTHVLKHEHFMKQFVEIQASKRRVLRTSNRYNDMLK